MASSKHQVLKYSRAPTADPISTYDVERLEQYYSAVVPTRWWPFTGKSQPEANLGYGGFTVGLKLPRMRSYAVRHAAWQWLRPRQPRTDVRLLAKEVGYPVLAFVPALIDACLEIARDHPAFAKWVERRIALAEFAVVQVPPPDQRLRHSELSLWRDLNEATSYLGRDRAVAASAAHQLSRTALLAAMQAVGDVLAQPKGFTGSATLMIPVARPERIAAAYFPGSAELENAESAHKLWRGVDASAALLIVAETIEPRHAGFWVPIASGSNTVLPGAPAAYANMIGSAVYTQDLPPLEDNQTLQRRWHFHMGNNFDEALFVSLPLTVFTSDESAEPLAVLNVNVTPTSGRHGWQRGYHLEWLEAARNRVASFAAIALWAYILRLYAGDAAFDLHLSPQAAAWTSLPGLSDGGFGRPLLPGARE